MEWILDFIERDEDARQQLNDGDVTAVKRSRDGRLWDIRKSDWGDDRVWERVRTTGHVLDTVVVESPVFIQKEVDSPRTADLGGGGADRPNLRGRKKGQGTLAQSDKPLIKEMHKLIEGGEEEVSVLSAAQQVAGKAKGAGTLDSKIDRLRKRYREVYPLKEL